MTKTSRTMRISVLTTVSALTLFGGAFVSTASADNTPAPTPTVSPAPNTNPLDAEVNNETDAQALIGDNQDEQDVLNAQANAGVNNEDAQAETPETPEAPEVDTEVDAVNAENQQESDSFNEDITQAEQSGNHDDAVELEADAAIVTSVTVPEATAIAADDTEAHAIITGVAAK